MYDDEPTFNKRTVSLLCQETELKRATVLRYLRGQLVPGGAKLLIESTIRSLREENGVIE